MLSRDSEELGQRLPRGLLKEDFLDLLLVWTHWLVAPRITVGERNSS